MNRPRLHIDREDAIMYGWLLVAFAIMAFVGLICVALIFGIGWLAVAVVWIAGALTTLAVAHAGRDDL